MKLHTKKPETELTLNLYDFCESFLRFDESRELESLSYIADVLEIKFKKDNTLLFHIEWPGKYNPSLESPRLWRYDSWKSYTGKWEMDKTRSEEERVMRFIFDENVRRVSKKMIEQLLMDENVAAMTASELLKKGRHFALKKLGVKLVTTKDEL